MTILRLQIQCDRCGDTTGDKTPKAITRSGSVLCESCGASDPDRIFMWITPKLAIMGTAKKPEMEPET
jgi:uncharacterized Zn finger protein